MPADLHPAVEDPGALVIEEDALPPMVKDEPKKELPIAMPEPAAKPEPDLIIPPEPEQPAWVKAEETPAEKTEASDKLPSVQNLIADLSKPATSMPPQTLKATTPTEDMSNTPDATPVADAPKLEQKPTVEPAKDKTESSESDQALESQNIFVMLGINSATDREKDMFLDELQQIIWEDFLNNDVNLLLTEDEEMEFAKIQKQEDVSQEDAQTQMVEYLEKLVPDLEKIMLEKALQLKEEMFIERITQMKKVNADKPEIVKEVEAAEKLQQDQKWLDATNALNEIAH
jgi:hypothetical protein